MNDLHLTLQQAHRINPNLLGDGHSFNLKVDARQVESAYMDQLLNGRIVEESHERRTLHRKEMEKGKKMRRVVKIRIIHLIS